MIKTTWFLMVAAMFSGCSNPYYVKHISDFHIDNSVLKDHELVEVIYAPVMPNDNADLTYFIQMIIVSKETGDTANLITTSWYDITDGDRIRNIIMVSDTFVSRQLDLISGSNQSGVNPKKITKVLVEKDFLPAIQNNYPTVMGSLGYVYEKDDVNKPAFEKYKLQEFIENSPSKE